MSGEPNYGYERFNSEAARLRCMGYTVYNPTERFNGDQSRSYAEYMRAHLENIWDSQAVAVLPGWEQSLGAMAEVALARAIGIPVNDSENVGRCRIFAAPLIAITGQKSSGKDTVAQFLVSHYGYTRHGLADNVRREVYEIVKDRFDSYEGYLQYVEGHKRDDLSTNAAWTRQILQAWASYRRDLFGQDYWLKQIPLTPGTAISDLRYADEVEAVRAAGGKVFRVIRPGFGSDGHASECQVANLRVDADILNDGTIDDLHRKVALLMEALIP